jgi:hypothetical protein
MTKRVWRNLQGMKEWSSTPLRTLQNKTEQGLIMLRM